MQPTGIDPDLQLTVRTAEVDEERSPDFIQRLTVLGEHKFFVLKFVGIVALLAVVVSLLLPKTYEANAKVMPPQQSPSSAATLLNQLSPLAALMGKDLGVRTQSDLYVDMLRSRLVADGLIQRFSLNQVYYCSPLFDVLHCKDITDVRKKLADSTFIEASLKDGLISIAVSDHDPQRAADLANAYVEELRKVTQTLAVTEASRRRLFFEQEVQKVSEELAQAEQALKETQEKTGMIELDSQARAMFTAGMTLRYQLAAKEAEVEAMRSYATPDNPSLKLAESELSALRTQLSRFEGGRAGGSITEFPLGRVPAAGLEYLRKLREVKYREALFEALSKQYEIARIDEAKDASVIQLLDHAVRPTKKAGPHRALIVILAVVPALLVAVMMVLLKEWANADRQRAARLRRLRSALSWRGGRA
jgi:tyrosine-protein kinase Etk/Wzc